MRYAGLPEAAVPQGESLAQMVTRVAPVWTQCLQPAPATGQRVLVTAHGNSLRALIKRIEGIADADIARLEIPNAVPMLIELDAWMRPFGRTLLGPATQPPSEVL
jgi:2,3-bisphosphoglycerate-dependent phosphoglycerate mutase